MENTVIYSFFSSQTIFGIIALVLSFIILNFFVTKITDKKILNIKLNDALNNNKKLYQIRNVKKTIVMGALPMSLSLLVYLIGNVFFMSGYNELSYINDLYAIPYITLLIIGILFISVLYKSNDFNLISDKYFVLTRNIVFISLFFYLYFNNLVILFGVNTGIYYVDLFINILIILSIIFSFITLDRIEGLLNAISIGCYIYFCLIFSNQNNYALASLSFFLFLINVLSYLFVLFDFFRIRINKYGKLANGLNAFILLYLIFMLSGKYIAPNAAINTEGLNIYYILFYIFIPIVDLVCRVLRRLIRFKNPFINDRNDIASVLLRVNISSKLIAFLLLIVSFMYQTLSYVIYYSEILFLPDWVIIVMFYFLLVYYVIVFINIDRKVPAIRRSSLVRIFIYDKVTRDRERFSVNKD